MPAPHHSYLQAGCPSWRPINSVDDQSTVSLLSRPIKQNWTWACRERSVRPPVAFQLHPVWDRSNQKQLSKADILCRTVKSLLQTTQNLPVIQQCYQMHKTLFQQIQHTNFQRFLPLNTKKLIKTPSWGLLWTKIWVTNDQLKTTKEKT